MKIKPPIGMVEPMVKLPECPKVVEKVKEWIKKGVEKAKDKKVNVKKAKGNIIDTKG